MKPHLLEKLAGAQGRVDLSTRIRELCAPYGRVVTLDLMPFAGGGYCCYVEIDPPDQRFAIMRELGGFAFARGVTFRIPLAPGKEGGCGKLFAPGG